MKIYISFLLIFACCLVNVNMSWLPSNWVERPMERSSYLKLDLDVHSGAFEITVGGMKWFSGKSYRLFSSKWYSSDDGSLKRDGSSLGNGCY